MLHNYLKIAFRNLWKHKTYTLINTVGLAVAFGSCLLLFLTAYHELSFDNFHTNGKNIYQLYNQTGLSNKGVPMPAPLTTALKKEFPQDIKHIVRVVSGGTIRYGDKSFSKTVRYVDEPFLQVFSFPTQRGARPESALSSLSSVVLTETAAKDIFGSENPIGKTLSLQDETGWKPFVVSSIVADYPDNSSFRFDMLVRFEADPTYQLNKDNWDDSYHTVFLQLADNVTQASFEQKLRGVVKKYYAGNLSNLKRDGSQPDENGDLYSLRLLPLRDLHFDPEVGTAEVPPVKKSYPYLLLIVAGFIVVIACINFINLSTARSLTRSREVGMRKALGALKSQLFLQFWGEALLISLFALTLGGLLTYGLLPVFKQVFRSTTSFSYFQQPAILISLLIGFLLITFVAGGYPAWFMARFNTIKVLKGGISLNRTSILRNTLLVVQFAIATLLITCTVIAWQQINFLRKMPLGYNEDQVISIPIRGSINGRQMLRLLRDRLSQQPRILSITGAYKNFGRGLDGSTVTSIMGFEHNNHSVQSHWQIVDYDYLKTLDLRLIAGRDFSREYATDTTTSVIINEAMAKALGDRNPIGALMQVDSGRAPLQVVGVVKDYHHESLKRKIQPNTLIMDQGWPIGYALVKIAPDNVPATMAMLKKTWEELDPNSTFQGSFLDENTDRLYKAEERLSQLFISAAIVAIVLSCLGLFAIAVMVMTQRTKEVGIRKVLGASVLSIVALLSNDFLKLVVAGIVIASPVAWYFMNQWLQDFAYKIDIEWWVFVLAGLLAIGIALLTVSFQSVKAALMNPVKSLRTE
ncbi:ABC transporter permease [Fibrisoma montanum]|uniref:ABC transporter permease n=1 Tax=Fibrisoma montanum TaxID=2305895 RepID=A0A418M500_9BACT|nr:ABC transporter permease [Fibrisoma montanum]RIV20789.1 ABC transporter permease [Fibrisoma montanum]